MTDLRRLLSFVLPVWPRVLLAVLLGALTIGASIGLLGTSAYLISYAALGPALGALQIAIVGVRFFGIARGVFRYLERLVSHDTTFRLLGRIRVWFYNAIEPLAPAGLASHRTGDLLTRAISDIETLENFYVRVLAPPLVAIVVVLGTSLWIGTFDPRLAFALSGFLLLVGVALTALTLILGRGPGQTLIESRARLRSDLVDGLQGLPDLLAYDGIDAHLRRIRSAESDLHHAQRRMALIGSGQSALNSLLTNLGVLVMLILSIPLVNSGRVDGIYHRAGCAGKFRIGAGTPTSRAVPRVQFSRGAAPVRDCRCRSRPERSRRATPGPVRNWHHGSRLDICLFRRNARP
jgi:ATP-binding cassette subfamily C protein CydC